MLVEHLWRSPFSHTPSFMDIKTLNCHILFQEKLTNSRLSTSVTFGQSFLFSTTSAYLSFKLMDDDICCKKEPQLPRRPSFKIKCVGRIALLYKSILFAWQCAVGLKITFKLKAHVTRRLKLDQIWNCIINRGLTMWWDHNWWCHINNHQQGIGVLRHWWKESCVQEDLDG